MVTVDGRRWLLEPASGRQSDGDGHRRAGPAVPASRLGAAAAADRDHGASRWAATARILFAEKYPHLMPQSPRSAPAIWTSYAQARGANADRVRLRPRILPSTTAVTHTGALTGIPVRVASGGLGPFPPRSGALARPCPAEQSWSSRGLSHEPVLSRAGASLAGVPGTAPHSLARVRSPFPDRCPPSLPLPARRPADGAFARPRSSGGRLKRPARKCNWRRCQARRGEGLIPFRRGARRSPVRCDLHSRGQRCGSGRGTVRQSRGCPPVPRPSAMLSGEALSGRVIDQSVERAGLLEVVRLASVPLVGARDACCGKSDIVRLDWSEPDRFEAVRLR